MLSALTFGGAHLAIKPSYLVVDYMSEYMYYAETEGFTVRLLQGYQVVWFYVRLRCGRHR